MFKDMSRAALSIFIFAIYLIFIGITMLFVPKMMSTIQLGEKYPTFHKTSRLYKKKFNLA